MALIRQQIEIQLSKIKLLLVLIGSLTFVALGLWLVISQPTIHVDSSTVDLIRLFIAGWLSIIFFGLCTLLSIRKLADNRPGLTINDIGITDNSSGISCGQIHWSDILNISVLKIQRQKFIMLQVKNPEDYINRQTSKFKRKMLKMNFNKFGSPLSISSNGLKISFNDLHKLLVDSYDAAKQREEKARPANSTYQ
jgi:hypothetical protein